MNPNPNISESMTSLSHVASAMGRTLSTMLLASLMSPQPRKKRRADPQLSMRQLAAVRTLMSDGEWRTLDEISAAVKGSPTSISARLRDLRKPQFGKMNVERKRDEDKVYWYRIPQEAQVEMRMAA